MNNGKRKIIEQTRRRKVKAVISLPRFGTTDFTDCAEAKSFMPFKNLPENFGKMRCGRELKIDMQLHSADLEEVGMKFGSDEHAKAMKLFLRDIR